MISMNMKDWNYFPQVLSERWMDSHRRAMFCHLQTYSRPCREGMKLCSFLYAWRKGSNHTEWPLGARQRPRCFTDDIIWSSQCCVVVLLPSVSNEETEANSMLHTHQVLSTLPWGVLVNTGSLELVFHNLGSLERGRELAFHNLGSLEWGL